MYTRDATAVLYRGTTGATTVTKIAVEEPLSYTLGFGPQVSPVDRARFRVFASHSIPPKYTEFGFPNSRVRLKINGATFSGVVVNKAVTPEWIEFDCVDEVLSVSDLVWRTQYATLATALGGTCWAGTVRDVLGTNVMFVVPDPDLLRFYHIPHRRVLGADFVEWANKGSDFLWFRDPPPVPHLGIPPYLYGELFWYSNGKWAPPEGRLPQSQYLEELIGTNSLSRMLMRFGTVEVECRGGTVINYVATVYPIESVAIQPGDYVYLAQPITIYGLFTDVIRSILATWVTSTFVINDESFDNALKHIGPIDAFVTINPISPQRPLSVLRDILSISGCTLKVTNGTVSLFPAMGVGTHPSFTATGLSTEAVSVDSDTVYNDVWIHGADDYHFHGSHAMYSGVKEFTINTDFTEQSINTALERYAMGAREGVAIMRYSRFGTPAIGKALNGKWVEYQCNFDPRRLVVEGEAYIATAHLNGPENVAISGVLCALDNPSFEDFTGTVPDGWETSGITARVAMPIGTGTYSCRLNSGATVYQVLNLNDTTNRSYFLGLNLVTTGSAHFRFTIRDPYGTTYRATGLATAISGGTATVCVMEACQSEIDYATVFISCVSGYTYVDNVTFGSARRGLGYTVGIGPTESPYLTGTLTKQAYVTDGTLFLSFYPSVNDWLIIGYAEIAGPVVAVSGGTASVAGRQRFNTRTHWADRIWPAGAPVYRIAAGSEDRPLWRYEPYYFRYTANSSYTSTSLGIVRGTVARFL